MLFLHGEEQPTQWSQGQAGFISEACGGHRYFIGVRCQLGSQVNAEIAQLDTAAEWSVISGEIAEELEGVDFGSGQLHVATL
jgi:hypothetical protein